MGLGKSFHKSIKSTKDMEYTYEVCKKICVDSNLKIKIDNFTPQKFEIIASEPMKWVSTNWPNTIEIKAEIFKDDTMVSLKADSKGVSITQDKNISDFLNNVYESLKNYLS